MTDAATRAAQVLKNTYLLLGLSLMAATGAAVFAMSRQKGSSKP